MKLNLTTFITICYFILFAIHFAVWKYALHLDVVLFLKYYAFIGCMICIMLLFMEQFERRLPKYLGFSVIGMSVLIFFAFLGFRYAMKEEFNDALIPGYKLHFIIPYLVFTALITFYAVQKMNKINLNKKD